MFYAKKKLSTSNEKASIFDEMCGQINNYIKSKIKMLLYTSISNAFTSCRKTQYIFVLIYISHEPKKLQK